MALSFPNSPSLNDVYTYGGKSWQWNGNYWISINYGQQGVSGAQGAQGLQGTQGLQGATGLAFTIAKTYASVAALTADTSPTAIISGQFALINTANVEDAENSRLYIWNGSSYIFVDDLSGAAGIQGVTGSQGVTGIQGALGTQGAQGTQGLQGIQGIQGATGSQGTLGAQGSQGLQGIQGTEGSQGIQGVQGLHGTSGTQGTQGAQGLQGVIGAQGTQGTAGFVGSNGAQGSQGVQGAQGAQGVQGTQGIQGLQGTAGSQGVQGLQGLQGTAGFVGSNGAQGIQGIQGVTGSQGSNGSTGNTGSTGAQGAQGIQGLQGIQGTIGTSVTGAQGTQGISGASILGTNNTFTGVNSININGTVGATTASTGAFTTLSASGLVSANAGLAVTGALSSTTGATFATSSGNLLVGTSSGSYSTISKSSAGNFVLELQNTSATSPSVLNLKYTATSGGAGDFIQCNDNVGLKFIVNAAGNVGIGVTPSAWGTNYKAIESAGNSTVAIAGANVNGVSLFSNAYATNASYIYKTTGQAAYYSVNLGQHQWFTAASGTAGNAISFTQAMTLDASGNLGIGTTSPIAKLDVNGSINFGPANGSCVAVGTTNTFTPSGGNPTAYYGMTFGGFVTNSISLSGYNGIAMYTGAGVERARIDSSGNVGIGTTSPVQTLSVTGTLSATSTVSVGANTGSTRVRVNGDGTPGFNIDISGSEKAAFYRNGSEIIVEGAGGYGIAINTNGATRAITVNTSQAIRFNTYGAGALTTDASGNITAASDERIKKNIRPFSRGLAEILAINPILHGYTEESGLDQSRDDYAGFSAQQVQAIIPEAIGENADGMLSFSDRPVMAALVNAMKELNANLVAELQSVRQRLAALEA